MTAGGVPCGSTPLPLDPDPAAIGTLGPVTGDPLSTAVGALLVMPGAPDIFAAVPVPASRHPAHCIGASRRRWRRYFDAGWRRRVRRHDLDRGAARRLDDAAGE